MRMADFRKMVDAYIESRCGLTTHCLGDFDLWPYYEDVWSDEQARVAADEAARDLLMEEGFPLEEE